MDSAETEGDAAIAEVVCNRKKDARRNAPVAGVVSDGKRAAGGKGGRATHL